MIDKKIRDLYCNFDIGELSLMGYDVVNAKIVKKDRKVVGTIPMKPVLTFPGFYSPKSLWNLLEKENPCFRIDAIAIYTNPCDFTIARLYYKAHKRIHPIEWAEKDFWGYFLVLPLQKVREEIKTK